MKRVVFKMQLKQGCEAEYSRLHNEIWPELVTLLKQSGIKDYHIYFDKETYMLIAVQHVDEHASVDISKEPLMQKWWNKMADLMEVNADKSPVVVGLDMIFSMP